MGTGLWQDWADQQVFHCLFIPTFACCLSILVESPFCIRALHHPVLVRRLFRLDQVGHASLEPGGNVSLGLKRDGAKTIKKNTNLTQNKSQTHRAKQYEVTSFLSTDCELSTETCSKNVYSLGPLCGVVWRWLDQRVSAGGPVKGIN